MIKRTLTEFSSSVSSLGSEKKQQQKNQQGVKRQRPLPVLPRFHSMAHQYQEAIKVLNSQLQTNHAVLEQVLIFLPEKLTLLLGRLLFNSGPLFNRQNVLFFNQTFFLSIRFGVVIHESPMTLPSISLLSTNYIALILLQPFS